MTATAMNGGDSPFRSPVHTLINHRLTTTHTINGVNGNNGDLKNKDLNSKNKKKKKKVKVTNRGMLGDAMFMKWTRKEILGVVRHHPLPCVFAASLLFFMAVEYTLYMIPHSSPPFDLGFIATARLHRFLASNPALNNLLAGLNTVFVFMQTAYILWTWLVEGRARATIATLFMFTFRGILGYSTQLPLPQGFLGSGVDFPVGNVSFFLFYSGHVAASIIAALDMKRMQRWKLARMFEILNILQMARLLATRGHYTIDLAVGIGAGMLFDSLAYDYQNSKKIPNTTVNGDFFTSSK